MPTPDVRVRLSAEGTAEVVAALKKVQAEGQKSSHAGGRSFLGFNSVLGSTTKLLAGLGVAIGVGSFVNFIRKSSDAADQIGKLGQKVGASVGNLSALNLAATTADVGTEQLTVGLTLLNRKIAELADGSPKAQATFRQLGLSAKDFKGKDAVESFELVSQRMAKLDDGARKTATAVDVFGRSGAQLIPLMNDLAEEGLGNLITRARELGVLLDEEMVASIQQTNDDFEILNLQSQALGAQFASGIAPALSQSLEIITGELGNTSAAWKKMGEGAGLVAKVLVAVVATAIDYVSASIQGTIGWIGDLVSAGKQALKGDFSGAGDILRERDAIETARAKALKERVENRFEMAFTMPPPSSPREEPPAPEEADPVELARKQAEAAKSIRDAELAHLKAQLKARVDAEKRSYEEGTSSLQAYFNERRRAVTEEANAEVAALQQRGVMLQFEDDQIKAQAEAKALDAQINRIRLEQEAAIAALTFEETRTLREGEEKSLEIERELLEARGRRHEAAMLAIEEEIKKTDLLLKNKGVPDDRRLLLLEQMRASKTAGADFEESQTQAQRAMTQLGMERQRIDAQVHAGLITQMQGEQQLIALEQARLPVLQQSAQALMAAALATGSPEQIQQAHEFALAVEEIGMAADNADRAMVRFRDALEQSGIQALTDFFAEGITSAQSFGAAVSQMASSVVASLRRIAAEMLATQIMKSLLSLLPGGGVKSGGTVGEGKARGGQVSGFSSGGFVRGPGTGTSDSLVALTDRGRPVRLSNGEFVVRAAAVQQPGALEFLRHFNRWSMATLRSAQPGPTPLRFAEGGIMGGGAAGGSPKTSDGRLTIGLDEGLVLKAFETPRGQKILVELVGRNRRTLQRVLEG